MTEETTAVKRDYSVSFKDLCLHIVLRWRSIIACTLIFGILLCGAKFALDLTKSNDSGSVASADSLGSGMTDAQIASAKGAVACKELFDNHALYMDSSILMEIPYSTVPTSTITFNISGPDSFLAANVLSSFVGSDEMLIKLNAYDDNPYVSELFNYKISNIESVENAEESKAYLSVYVYGKDKESSVALSNETEKYLNEKAALIAADTDCIFFATRNTYAVSYQENVRIIQQNAVNLYNNLRGALKEALTLLDSAELAYYNSAVAGSPAEQTTAENNPNPKPSISIKYFVLGAVAGFVFAVLWHFAAYLFAKKVKSAEDVKIRCALNILGDLEAGNSKRSCFIDRFILKLFGTAKPDSTEVAAHRIKAAMAISQAENLLIISDEKTSESAAKSELCAALKELGVSNTVTESPLNSAKKLALFSSADCVLLLKSVNSSAYAEINRELELAELYGNTVIGAAIIR